MTALTLRPSSAVVWITASRPKTLGASIAPVVMGGALAYRDGYFSSPLWVCTLVAAVLLQIGANWVNDYADFLKGSDGVGRLGPLRVMQAGWVSQSQMQRACVAVFSLAAVLGMALVARAGWPIVLIGVLAIASATLYTVGRYAIAYIGLGELFVLLFFGLTAVSGTYYIQTLHFSLESCLLGLCPGLMSTAIIVINNLRDVESDRRVAKKTLAVRLGVRVARIEYVLCVQAAMAVLLVDVLFMGAPLAELLALVPVVLLVRPIQQVLGGSEGPPLNHILAKTGQTLLLMAIVYAGVQWTCK